MGEIPFTGTLKIGHSADWLFSAQNQAQLWMRESYHLPDHRQRGNRRMRLKVNDLQGPLCLAARLQEKYVKVLGVGGNAESSGYDQTPAPNR